MSTKNGKSLGRYGRACNRLMNHLIARHGYSLEDAQRIAFPPANTQSSPHAADCYLITGQSGWCTCGKVKP